MQPQLGSIWRDCKRETVYIVVRVLAGDLASRCKNGEQAYLWVWTGTGDNCVIAPALRKNEDSSSLSMKLPVKVRLNVETARWENVVLYQDRKDRQLLVEYSDEFLDGRYEEVRP